MRVAAGRQGMAATSAIASALLLLGARPAAGAQVVRPEVSWQGVVDWASATERSIAARASADASVFTRFLWREVLPAGDDGADGADDAPADEEAGAPDEDGPSGLYFRPVSCTLYCVMALTIEALAVFTGLAVARNVADMSGQPNGSVATETLTCATRSAVYAPMLCLLFVSCRMFVLATTNGLGEPPLWVKTAMVVASFGMTFQFFVILLLPFTTEGREKQGARLSELSGETADVHPSLWAHKYTSNGARSLIYAVQGFSILCLYCGVVGVLVGIITFPAQATKMSAAVRCTVALCGLYFGVHLLVWVLRTQAELRMPPDRGTRATKRAAIAASECVKKAPMFAVIFLAARMRALQLDPPFGMPPPWAQMCFFTITGALTCEVVLTAIAALFSTGEESGEEAPSGSQSCLFWLRSLVEFAAYAMQLPIIQAMREMKDTNGGTHPLSTTTKAILQLGALFFGVCVLQMLVSVFQRASAQSWAKSRKTLEGAALSVGICPQLAVLFLATRMRALQITNQQGDPPDWAQRAMLISVFAMVVQLLSVLALPLFTGSATEVDEDGLPQYDMQPMVAAYSVSVVKYVALICLYGGVLAVCAAVFAMTPENCKRVDHTAVRSDYVYLKGLVGMLAILMIAMILSSAKVVGLAIKFGIESVDRVILGTDITVGKVALDICKGAVSVADVVIENPKARNGHEWLSPYLLKIDRILFDLNTLKAIKSLGKDIHVEAIKLEGLDCCFELPKFGEASNVSIIVEHLEGLTGKKKPDDAAASPASGSQGGAAGATGGKGKEEKDAEQKKPAASDAKGPEVAVEEVSICDIGAGAYVAGMLLRFELDDIKFEDFSKKFMEKKGAVVGDIIKVIVKTFLKTILANKKIMGQAMKAAGHRMVQGIKDKFGKRGGAEETEEVPDCPLLDR